MDPDVDDPFEGVPAINCLQERGPSTPTRTPRARSWSSIAYECLPEKLQNNLRRWWCSEDSDALRYGSDCSGIDGPLHALRDILATIYEDAKGKVNAATKPVLQYVYASEANNAKGDGPKLALTLNGAPDTLWSDGTSFQVDKKNAAKPLKGFCCYDRRPISRKKAFLYTV